MFVIWAHMNVDLTLAVLVTHTNTHAQACKDTAHAQVFSRIIAFSFSFSLCAAQQECPKSGILWAEAIEMEERPKRKAKALTALKSCDRDPHVMLATAKLFWFDRSLDKARNWLENKVLRFNPDFGDAWATLYKFEVQHGTKEQQESVVARCKEADPKHGEKWQQISKATGARCQCLVPMFSPGA